MWRAWVTGLGLGLILLALAAVVTGHIVKARSKKSLEPSPKGPRLGLTMAYVGLVLSLLMIPLVFRANVTPAKNACINNLRQIDGAKEQWALEMKKTATDTPKWNDLIGTDKYIKYMPECEQGGYYFLNNMATKPTCTYPSHTLQ